MGHRLEELPHELGGFRVRTQQQLLGSCCPALGGVGAASRGEVREDLLDSVTTACMGAQHLPRRVDPAVAVVQNGEIEEAARRLAGEERSDASGRVAVPDDVRLIRRLVETSPETFEAGKHGRRPRRLCEHAPGSGDRVKGLVEPAAGRAEIDEELDLRRVVRKLQPAETSHHFEGKRVDGVEVELPRPMRLLPCAVTAVDAHREAGDGHGDEERPGQGE